MQDFSHQQYVTRFWGESSLSSLQTLNSERSSILWPKKVEGNKEKVGNGYFRAVDFCFRFILHPLPETNSSHLKFDGWKDYVSLEKAYFQVLC